MNKFNDENELPRLTLRQIFISEEIQTQLAPIITEYLDEKASLIDALDWILTVIVNDKHNDLDVYGDSWIKTYREVLRDELD